MGIEGPIFCRQKINYQPRLDITGFSAVDGRIFQIQNHRQLVELDQLQEQRTIDICRSDGKILNFWVSPYEPHAIVFSALQNGLQQTLFLPVGATRVKLLKELKTKSVTAVAWISPNLIVLGTSEGEIISCLIENTETYFGGNLGHTIKQHHVIKNEAISGIVSCTTTGPSNQNRVILAATTSKLVHFIGPNGRDNVDAIFTGYTAGSNVISFEATSTFDSKLVLSPIDKKKHVFAWSCISGQEVFVGEIQPGADRSRTITNNKIITGHGQSGVINDIALSKFHVLTMHQNAIVATCLLNNQLVFSDEFDRKDPIVGFRQNSTEGNLWAFSRKSMFTYRIKNEGRSVWRIYLELEDFEEAKKHCHHNAENLDEVLIQQATSLLDKAIKNPNASDFREAARIFAKSNASVTEVSLKLMPLNGSGDENTEIDKLRNGAIIFFLKTRLPRVERFTEKALLIGWLLELYLTKLSDLIDYHGKGSEEVSNHRTNFFRFIQDPSIKSIVFTMKPTLYNLLQQHGATSDFNKIAALIGDNEAIIVNSIQREDWPQAAKILEEENDESLYYKYSSSLLPHVPGLLCSGWQKCDKIDPDELLSVMASSMTKSVECRKSVLKYLNSIMNGYISLSVSNLHFSMLCSIDLKTAEKYVIDSSENKSLSCEISYALRCLQSYGAGPKSICYLLSLLSRWEEAIVLAIEEGSDGLWRKLAEKASEDSSVSSSTMKEIWLKIAEHEIGKDSSVTADILSASNGVITVADVLKYFPEFATIDHFKQALCSSLVAVSRQIDEHQSKLVQTQQAADEVRQEIKEVQRSVRTLTLKDKCHLTFEPLLNEAFLIYHCGHQVHTKAAILEEISICRDSSRKIRLEDVKQLIDKMDKFEPGIKGNEKIGVDLKARTEKMVTETIGDECCFCGLRAVDSIDIPLMDPNDDPW